MPNSLFVLFVWIVFASLSARVVDSTASAAEPPHVADLAFMVGCWQGPIDAGSARRGSAGPLVRECWNDPYGGLMLGNSQTVTGEADGVTTRAFEYLRIEDGPEGVLYRPAPGGRAAAVFRLVEHAVDRAVFENPENDFPQRIVYQRLHEGAVLVARIETLDGAEAQEFRMQRLESAAVCGGESPRLSDRPE